MGIRHIPRSFPNSRRPEISAVGAGAGPCRTCEIRESLEGYLVFSERFSVRVRCLVYEPESIMMRHSIGSVQEICCGLFVAFACGGQIRHEYGVDLVSIPFGTRRASIHAKPPNPKVWCDYQQNYTACVK